MHRSKAVCQHGRPWYAECLDCAREKRFGDKDERFWQDSTGCLHYELSNRHAFFAAHPEAAQEITR